jgi:L-asparaginase
MSIAVFTTGGTIDKVYFDAKGGYQVGAPMVLELLRHARLPTLPEVTELPAKTARNDRGGLGEAIRTAVAAS